jgi:hypothetical protein
MNLEKSKKRIAKRVKMGFQGYPLVTITYQSHADMQDNEVLVSFLLEEGAQAQEEHLVSKTDAREDELIQSTLVKIIERSGAKTVSLSS